MSLSNTLLVCPAPATLAAVLFLSFIASCFCFLSSIGFPSPLPLPSVDFSDEAIEAPSPSFSGTCPSSTSFTLFARSSAFATRLVKFLTSTLRTTTTPLPALSSILATRASSIWAASLGSSPAFLSPDRSTTPLYSFTISVSFSFSSNIFFTHILYCSSSWSKISSPHIILFSLPSAAATSISVVAPLMCFLSVSFIFPPSLFVSSILRISPSSMSPNFCASLSSSGIDFITQVAPSSLS